MSKALDLGKVNVEELLEALDVENVSGDHPDEFVFSCPFPGHSHGDDTPSAFMNKQTTAWFCHGCKRRGNAITFLAEHEDVSRFQAVRFLREQFDSDFREPVGSFASEWDAHFAPDPAEPSGAPVALDESEAEDRSIDWAAFAEAAERDESLLDTALGYMLRRGFSPEVLDRWQVGYDEISARITIPVRDADGTLVGFKGRATTPDQKPKYLILGDRPGRPERFGFAPYNGAQVVFGLDRVGQTDEICAVEGELNVIAMDQMGFPDTVALGGSYVSPRHAALLRWHADRLVLFFDSLKPNEEKDGTPIIGPRVVPDKAGNEATAIAVEAFERYMPVRIVEPHLGDPADMDREEVGELLRTAQSSLTATIDL